MTKKKAKTDLTLVGHLAELRKRLIIIGVSVVVLSIVAYAFTGHIATELVNKSPNMEFIFISPSELMLAYIRIAVYLGLVASLPIVITQIWLFVSPGFERKHKKYALLSIFLGSIFFIAGIAFAYVIVLPVVFEFFAGFQTSEITANISFSSHLSFVVSMLLAFGLIFELPILMYLFTRIGIVKTSFFTGNRKYMVLLIFIIAALLTPPDIISQTLLAVPMLVLYELGIIFSKLGARKKKKKKTKA